MKKLALLALVAMLVVSMTAVMASDHNTVTYTGQGFYEGVLETILCGEDADFGQDMAFEIGEGGGYLKWVLTARGAESATISGPWGTFEMIQAGGGAFHKATDYYPVEFLIDYPVTATWIGDVRGSVQLTVSNGCPTNIFEGETAWAANGDEPGEIRYNPQGNWATYVEYFGVAKTTTMFAGQTMDAGNAHFSAPLDGYITITITLADGWEFQDVVENLKVQDYDARPIGNPNPGLFDWKETCTENTCTINVPANGFYGVHADVGQWVPFGSYDSNGGYLLAFYKSMNFFPLYLPAILGR